MARNQRAVGLSALAALLFLPLTPGRAEVFFLRGNVDAAGGVNLTDGIYLLNHLFLGGPAPPCGDAADVDDDGQLNLTDSIYLLNFLFLGGPTPPVPYPVCGCDPTDGDRLRCDAFPACTPATVSIQGRVVDLFGNPIPAVAVGLGAGGATAAPLTTLTDARGYFARDVSPSAFTSGELLIGASAPGFSRNQTAVDFAAGQCVYERTFVLLSLDVPGAGTTVESTSLPAAGMSAVVVQNGRFRGSVVIPAHAIDAIHERVRLEFLVIDPTTAELQAFPGGDLRTLSPEGRRILETVGGAEVRLTDIDTEVPIRGLALRATVLLAIAAERQADFPCDDRVPLWSYDESGGSYAQDGEAVVRCDPQGKNKNIEISTNHFSIFNVGRLLESACFSVRFVRDGTSAPLGDLEAAAEGVSYGGLSRGRPLAVSNTGTAFTVKRSVGAGEAPPERVETVRLRVRFDGETQYLRDDGAGRHLLTPDPAMATPFPTPVEAGSFDDDPAACVDLGDLRIVLNRPPRVAIAADKLQTCPGRPVNLVAEATDPDGDMPLTILWTAPDGGSFGSPAEAQQAAVSWSPPTMAGPYRLVVQVTDSRGLATQREVSVMVTASCCPEIRRVRASNGPGGSDIGDVDPRLVPDLTLTATVSSIDPVTFAWFGPGLNGVPGNPITSLAAFMGAGPQTYTVRVSTASCTVEGSTTVNVLNQPPRIDALTIPSPGPCNGERTVQVAAQDPDGDAVRYAWSASGGSIDNRNSASTIWTAPAVGTHTITVVVTDIFGASSTRSVAARVDNTPPVIEQVLAPRVVPASGTIVTQVFGSAGTGPGQLRNPNGVAFDAAGNIIVSDNLNHRIQIFDPNGKLRFAFGSMGSAPGQFLNPGGVDVDPEGNIIVADSGNHRVQVFDSGGVFLRAFGAFGSGPGQFNMPRDVVFNALQLWIVVSDFFNNRIEVFNPSGQFIFQFGSPGSGPGEFDGPVGVAEDVGEILVADSGNNRVQQFTGTQFDSEIGVGDLNGPIGIDVAYTGQIVTSDQDSIAFFSTIRGKFTRLLRCLRQAPKGCGGFLETHQPVVFISAF